MRYVNYTKIAEEAAKAGRSFSDLAADTLRFPFSEGPEKDIKTVQALAKGFCAVKGGRVDIEEGVDSLTVIYYNP